MDLESFITKISKMHRRELFDFERNVFASNADDSIKRRLNQAILDRLNCLDNEVSANVEFSEIEED